MVEWLLHPWDLPIAGRSIVGLIFLCAAFAPMSIFVMQRGLSLAGEALTHGTLPGLWLSYSFLGSSSLMVAAGGYVAAWLIVILAAALAWRSLFRTDAVMGAVYIGFYALGILLISLSSTAVDFLSFIQGSPLAVSWRLVELCAFVALIIWVGMLILRRPLTLLTQDPAFFAALYLRGWWVTQGFMALFVLGLITALMTYGVIFAIALAILPGMAARCWANSLMTLWFLSFALGLLGFVGGFVIGLYADDLATSPLMVLNAVAIWLVSYLAGPFGLRRALQSA